MEITSAHIKRISTDLGADLCGIAAIESFEHAPVGFHPCDILSGCRSVVVLAKRFLAGTLSARSTIPYTIVRNLLSDKMDVLSLELAYHMESMGVSAVPTGAIGPCEWDEAANKKRGILSLKHAAELAGLGKIGKNTLLINDTFGNMLWLSAVVTSMELNPDPPAAYQGCTPECRTCLESCPVRALDGISIDQRRCWDYAFGTHNGGEWRIKCFTCRKVCPNHRGIRRQLGSFGNY